MRNQPSPTPRFLDGGGEMGALIRAHDWSGTALGPPDAWHESLRSTLGLCLDSAFPIAIYWGRDLNLLYNDAWRPILGDKHPWGLGRPAREVWPEIWEAIEPVFAKVLATGKGVFNGDSLLAMKRYGYVEECYFDYTFNPIRAGSSIAGIFNVVIETTYRVIGERRARVQRDFAARLSAAKSMDDVLALAAESLAEDAIDVPFSLVYKVAPDGQHAELAHASGLQPGTRAAPERVALNGEASVWPLGEAARTGETQAVPAPDGIGPLPGGSWPEHAREALVLPVAVGGVSTPAALLVAGVSPRRALDEEYRAFFESLAAHMSRAMTSAEAYAAQMKRAEALAELDRAKTTFFSNVSHEFRTPLTLMLGPLEDVLGEPGEKVTAERGTLESMQRNGQRLLKLVNTLLDFARIEAGRMQASYEPTDLATLTADLASNFRSACERAGLTLHVECPPLLEPAFVDRELWEKIVLNLISNAFKFTLEGGIRVVVRQGGRHFLVEVHDTGVGIPAAELPRMFERFHRIEGTKGRSHEGSGIGLALVHELVKLHGGSISVESEPGRGSTFTVLLPRGSSHLPAHHLKAPREGSTGARSEAYVEEALSWLPGVDAELPRAANAGVPRVLVADDNSDLRDYARRLLAERYDVTTVSDGAAALAAARTQRPDLIVSDVMMPQLDGFALIRELRADPQLRSIPVVLLSARAGEEARLEGLAKGADDYLVKPFNARELLVRVGALLEAVRARRSAMEEIARLSGVAAVGLTRCSRDLRYLSANRAYAELIGLPLEQIEGRLIAGVLGEAAFRSILPHIERVLGGEDVDYEERVVFPRGPRWIHVSYRPDRDETASVVGWVASVSDITERRAAEEALREADRRKDEFLATLSHELRNPLSPLKNALELLKHTASEDRGVAPLREMMERQVNHLVRLVDDLLEMSRITNGALDLRKERIALASVVKDAIDTARPLIEGARQELRVKLPDHDLWLDGDAVRVAQLLGNLLNNAAKYAGNGRVVELSAWREKGTAVISVRDNGPGIPAELLPRLFDMFSRGQDAATRAQSGLGVGLALARKLTELHGGTIEAKSGGVGLGAEFIVRLPLSAQQGNAREEAPGGSKQTNSIRVLVVDDNRDAATSMAQLLKIAGCDTLVGYGGEEAVALAQEHRPDVILLDIGMPGMDGYAACRAIRGLGGGSEIKIVAVTGWGQAEDRRRSSEAGFNAHLVKPADFGALQALLSSVG